MKTIIAFGTIVIGVSGLALVALKGVGFESNRTLRDLSSSFIMVWLLLTGVSILMPSVGLFCFSILCLVIGIQAERIHRQRESKSKSEDWTARAEQDPTRFLNAAPTGIENLESDFVELVCVDRLFVIGPVPKKDVVAIMERFPTMLNSLGNDFLLSEDDLELIPELTESFTDSVRQYFDDVDFMRLRWLPLTQQPRG